MAKAKQMVDLLMFVTDKHTFRNKAMVKYYHKIYVKKEIIELSNGMIDGLRFCGRSVFFPSWNPIQVLFYNYNLLSISTKWRHLLKLFWSFAWTAHLINEMVPFFLKIYVHTMKSNTSWVLNLKKEPRKICLVEKNLSDTSLGDEMMDSLPESKGPLRLLQVHQFKPKLH